MIALRTLIIATGLSVLGGCYNVSYVSKTRMPSTKKIDHDLGFWLWGLVGVEHIDLQKDCGADGVAKIRSRNTFVDEVLTVITLGIYAPRTTTVTCAQATQASRDPRVAPDAVATTKAGSMGGAP
jgi:hypothetical protein